jgi:hypothetical protein
MFVGWIRKGSFEEELTKLSQAVVLDKNLIEKTAGQNLAFGAYDGDELVATITLYKFETHLLINNFVYSEHLDDTFKERLIKVLLNNIYEEKPIMVLASEREQKLFKAFGFEKYADVSKALYSGGSSFNFSNSMAKSISGENYPQTVNRIDRAAYGESRLNYLNHMLIKSSSLIQGSASGYQHSYALNRSIVKISPWIMDDAAFSDAEKMMRGVIYHRGLKRLVAFIPSKVEEIVDLYRSYKFELEEGYQLMVKSGKLDINLEMIYGL